jgi:hypothetical protein
MGAYRIRLSVGDVYRNDNETGGFYIAASRTKQRRTKAYLEMPYLRQTTATLSAHVDT